MATGSNSLLLTQDVGTGMTQQKFDVPDKSKALALSFPEERRTLVSLCRGGEIQLWDLTTGTMTTQWRLRDFGPLKRASLLPKHSLVATVSKENDWDLDL